MREHNRLAAQVSSSNPGDSDETVYQKARRLVTAEWQNIIYAEWLPIILGPGAVRKYKLGVGKEDFN